MSILDKLFAGTNVTISETASIQEAAKLMADKKVGCLLVINKDTDAQKPIGIITDRDIVLKIVAKHTDLTQATVAEAMSKDLLTVKSEDGIKKSIEAMRKKGVRRAPVMENEKLCGVVSADDFMIRIADQLNELAALVKEQTGAK